MLKKVFLAAAATLILAGTSMTVVPAPAQAGNPCHHMAMSKAQKKTCKSHYKAYKKAHRKHQ